MRRALAMDARPQVDRIVSVWQAPPMEPIAPALVFIEVGRRRRAAPVIVATGG